MTSGDDRNVRRTAASVRYSRWPGWIWAIPLAALGVVVWLAVRALATGGVDITVVFDTAAGMQAGSTQVQYRGLSVGKVVGISLNPDGLHVNTKLNIHDEAKQYLRSGTRFWLQGASPSFSDLNSLKAIVAGPTVIMEPGNGTPSRHFIGSDHRPTIIAADDPMVSYEMSFDGDVGQLKIDAPVQLRGFTVGRVAYVGMDFDESTGALQCPVIVELDAKRFSIRGLRSPVQHWVPVLNQALKRLVSEGLRARLVQNPPLIGSPVISLDFVANAPPATLASAGSLLRIPTAPGGLTSIVNRINQVPVDKIADQVLGITRQVNAIVSSPEVRSSINNLNESLIELNKVIHQSGPQISALAESLRKTGAELDHTVAEVNRILGNGPNTEQNRNLESALYQLTEAARSVRLLADYLDRHPEALVRGRGE